MKCCVDCVGKIKSKGKCNHSEYKICNIEDIENEKKNKLKENIIYLEELSKTLEDSIKDLKNIFEKIEKNKEDLKLEIQKIFTKIRSTLNEREDQLLTEIDNKFDELYFNEEFIKNSEKFPKKVKASLENGKLTENDWEENNNNLNYLINNCINIESNLLDINNIKEKINKYNSLIVDIKFYLGSENNDIYEKIKKLGVKRLLWY